MPATYTPITQVEFEEFLGVDPDTGKPLPGSDKHFYRLNLKEIDPDDKTVELVYGKVVSTGLTLRIYSTIVPGYGTRDKGEDAIRTLMFWSPNPKDRTIKPKLVGSEKIVKRTQGWRDSLTDRIEKWQDQAGPVCRCGAPTVQKQKRGSKPGQGLFWGCVLWPNCPADAKPAQSGKTETATAKVGTNGHAAPAPNPEFAYVPLTFSQLHFLMVSAMADTKIPTETLAAAASVLYGNPEAFRVTEKGIEMHAGIQRWLPDGERPKS